jgi:glutamate synthase domain-containing protein 3
MSGGVAYVYDVENAFPKNVNKEMVALEDLENEDLDTLKFYIERHLKYTNSDVAKNILDNWEITSKYFIKVMPTDYKKVLAERKVKASTINV